MKSNMTKDFDRKAKLCLRDGGPVVGPGTGTSDDVPLKGSNGEYMLPADTVAAVGIGTLDALKNATHTPVDQTMSGHYANGGLIDDPLHQVETTAPSLRQVAPGITQTTPGVFNAEPIQNPGRAMPRPAPVAPAANVGTPAPVDLRSAIAANPAQTGLGDALAGRMPGADPSPMTRAPAVPIERGAAWQAAGERGGAAVRKMLPSINATPNLGGAVAGLASFGPDLGALGNDSALTFGQQAKLFGRDASRAVGGVIGGAVGAGVGTGLATPGVGTVVGGGLGGMAGMQAADWITGGLRKGANLINEKLGGSKDYFSSVDDDMRATGYNPNRTLGDAVMQRPEREGVRLTPGAAARVARGELKDGAPAAQAPNTSLPDSPERAAEMNRISGDATTARIHAITAQTESGGNDNAVGPYVPGQGNAKGSMQVMDATNRDPGYGVRPAADNSPAERARVGRDYITALRNNYGGDMGKAWAAYNAGPGNVDKAISDAAKSGGNWLDALSKYQSPENHAQTVGYVQKNLAALGGNTAAPGGQQVAQTATQGLRQGPPQDQGVEIIRGTRSSFTDPNNAQGARDRLSEMMDKVRDSYNGHIDPAAAANVMKTYTEGEGLRAQNSANLENARATREMARADRERQALQFGVTSRREQAAQDRMNAADDQNRRQTADNELQKFIEQNNTTADKDGKPTFDANAVGRQRKIFEKIMADMKDANGKSISSAADLDKHDRQMIMAAAHLYDKVENDADNWNYFTPSHLGESGPTGLINMTRTVDGGQTYRLVNGKRVPGVVIPERYLRKQNADRIGGVPTNDYDILFGDK